jgi:hypothetical protein
MPRNVKIALAVLVALEADSIYNLHLDLLMKSDAPPLLLWSALTPQALYLPVLVCLFLRQHWARIAMIVFFALSLLGTGLAEYTYQHLPANVTRQRDASYVLTTFGLLVLHGGAIGLLFTRAANAWYRPRAAR